MGRQLKRVPLDFSYPLKKTWKGYLNPFYKECPHCVDGYTGGRRRLEGIVRLLMLSGSDSLNGKNHPYFTHISKFVYGFGIAPTPDLAELTTKLAGRSPDRLFGHDGCDNWKAVDTIIKSAGLNPKKWGICKKCKGEAIDPKVSKKYNSWKEHDPPKGKGFQLWENTSEGSPVSPVFETLAKLCEWCESNATTFASSKTSKENWMKMLKDDNVHHQEGNCVFI